MERVVDVSAIAVISASCASVAGLTIRCLFKFLDHRQDRGLAREIFAETGLAGALIFYTELRRAEQPVIIMGRKAFTSGPDAQAPSNPGL